MLALSLFNGLVEVSNQSREKIVGFIGIAATTFPHETLKPEISTAT